MLNYSDQKITEGIRNGDNKVLKDLYKEYFPMVLSFVFKNSGTRDEAHDIFQETLVSVLKNVSKDKFRLNCKFFTYFCSIFRRQWYYYFRSKTGRKKIIVSYDLFIVDDSIDIVPAKNMISEEENMEECFFKNEREKLYLKYFEKLKEECKKIITLFLTESPMEMIASVMGFKSERVARHRKYQCLDELKRRIKNDRIYNELMSPVGKNKIEI